MQKVQLNADLFNTTDQEDNKIENNIYDELQV